MNEPGPKKLKHVVCVRFLPGTEEEQIRMVERSFAELTEKIEGITGFESGRNVSVENKHKGFTHIWVLTFRNEEGRDRYLSHPAHRAFSELLAKLRDDVFVFDYLIGED
ncbi:MAG TPA: Dabb family protein [archaeon]|nr:Dabb family protein [archaeon]